MQDVFRHSCFMYNDYAHNVSLSLWFKLGHSREKIEVENMYSFWWWWPYLLTIHQTRP